MFAVEPKRNTLPLVGRVDREAIGVGVDCYLIRRALGSWNGFFEPFLLIRIGTPWRPKVSRRPLIRNRS